MSGTPTVAKADRPTAEAYDHAAWLLLCEPRALKAIATVEAGPEGAFLSTGEPVVLFERHVFHRLTKGKFDGHPDISNEDPGGYGKYSAQHARLAEAVKLDKIAALKSASWGLFQIMGENHAAAGFRDVSLGDGSGVQRFVNAMYRSADDHLRALVMFLQNDSRLVGALRTKNWPAFAYVYNGPAYEKHDYHGRIAAAYASLA